MSPRRPRVPIPNFTQPKFSTNTTTRLTLSKNGMTETAVPCNRCPGCLAGVSCQKPWRGVALPTPHCTACGHNPHEGECEGCPCARRRWGWADAGPAAFVRPSGAATEGGSSDEGDGGEGGAAEGAE